MSLKTGREGTFVVQWQKFGNAVTCRNVEIGIYTLDSTAYQLRGFSSVESPAWLPLAIYYKIKEEKDELKKELLGFGAKFRGNINDSGSARLKNKSVLFPGSLDDKLFSN